MPHPRDLGRPLYCQGHRELEVCPKLRCCVALPCLADYNDAVPISHFLFFRYFTTHWKQQQQPQKPPLRHWWPWNPVGTCSNSMLPMCDPRKPCKRLLVILLALRRYSLVVAATAKYRHDRSDVLSWTKWMAWVLVIAVAWLSSFSSSNIAECPLFAFATIDNPKK